MKTIIFDTSSIISIATNELIPVFKSLKGKFNGDFIISESVKKEVIDYPLTTKKFKLEAIMLLDCLTKNYLKLYESNDVRKKAEYLLSLVNEIFKADKDYIRIVDLAEVESLTLAIYLNSEVYVVDERTMRLVIENPKQLAELLAKKLQTKITINNENLKKFKDEVGSVKIIRSTELMTLAYEIGLFDDLIGKNKIIKKDLRPMLLEGLLWGLKLRGCSISQEEIDEIIKLEGF